MSDMKCPFCQQELESHNYTSGRFRHTVMCVNKDCKLDGVVLPKIIWQELICTRKALDVAMDLLKIMNDGLPNGNRWKWEIEKSLDQIKQITEKRKKNENTRTN